MLDRHGIMIIFGGANYWHSNPQTFLAIRTADLKDNWYYRLYHNDVFFEELCYKYTNEFRPQLERMRGDIEKVWKNIYDSAYMNSKRWNVNLFYDDLEYLSDFIGRRMEFLDRAWIKKDCTYYVAVQHGVYYRYYTIFEQLTIEELFLKEKINVDIGKLVYRESGELAGKSDIIKSDIILDNVDAQ